MRAGAGRELPIGRWDDVMSIIGPTPYVVYDLCHAVVNTMAGRVFIIGVG